MSYYRYDGSIGFLPIPQMIRDNKYLSIIGENCIEKRHKNDIIFSNIENNYFI